MTSEAKTYSFGHIRLPASQVFYESPTGLSYASVNLMPVLPGHCLVMPVRRVVRVKDLKVEELSDMWVTAQKIIRIMERKYSSTAFTLAIQDGKDAGQTIPHVHIHILPRHTNDIPNNDEIYTMLEETTPTKKIVLDVTRVPRTADEMASEANEYRTLLGSVEEESE
jgi:bis(5'-adenosyl)-triphosphatase